MAERQALREARCESATLSADGLCHSLISRHNSSSESQQHGTQQDRNLHSSSMGHEASQLSCLGVLWRQSTRRE